MKTSPECVVTISQRRPLQPTSKGADIDEYRASDIEIVPSTVSDCNLHLASRWGLDHARERLAKYREYLATPPEFVVANGYSDADDCDNFAWAVREIESIEVMGLDSAKSHVAQWRAWLDSDTQQQSNTRMGSRYGTAEQCEALARYIDWQERRGPAPRRRTVGGD